MRETCSHTVPVDFPIPGKEASALASAELHTAVCGMMRALDWLPKDYRVNKALIQFEKIAMALEEDTR